MTSKKELQEAEAKGQDFNDWLNIEMKPGSAAGRTVWQKAAQSWEAKGKPITKQEVLILMQGLLSLDDIREINEGTSPILAGFNLIDELEAGHANVT